MENKLTYSNSYAKVSSNSYKHYVNSVGNNLQSIQITTKYRYKMMRSKKLKEFCKVSITEACLRHKIELVILKVLPEHVHLIVDCPRTLSISKLLQLIKGFSSYLMFRLSEGIGLRYPRRHFWSEGYFCASCGSDFDKAYSYIENQEKHHGLAKY